MNKWLVEIGLVLIGVGLPSVCLAQSSPSSAPPDGRSDMRADKIVDQDTGVSVRRPDGWVNGKSTRKGTMAVFSAAGDDQSQIDVLVSHLERDSAVEAFFRSFRTNLQKAGLVKRQEPREVAYGGKDGLETEYDASAETGQFRLVVWQFHRGDAAVVVTGFFPVKQRDTYYRDFKEVVESVHIK